MDLFQIRLHAGDPGHDPLAEKFFVVHPHDRPVAENVVGIRAMLMAADERIPLGAFHIGY